MLNNLQSRGYSAEAGGGGAGGGGGGGGSSAVYPPLQSLRFGRR